MKTEFLIGNAPAVLYDEGAKDVILYIHGLCGSKAEAERFHHIASRFGYATLGIDLPEHGGRRDGKKLVPWVVTEELAALFRYAKEHFDSVSLRAVSIGAWFSLLSFEKEPLRACLFSSPLVDMEDMILSMMHLAGVDEERLQKEKEIPTDFGQTLSWEYLTYVRAHPVGKISDRTAILYATGDETVRRETVERYARLSGADLCLYPGGEHYLHTPEEVAFTEAWEERMLRCYSEKA